VLERLSGFIAQKRRFYQIYCEVFAGIPEITMQKQVPGAVTSAWLSSIKIDTRKTGLTIPEIQNRLKEKGIPTRRIFNPLNDMPPYRKYCAGQEYQATFELYENGLSLPSSTLNSEESIYWAAQSVLEVLKK
jgi:perosamine synthetase